MWVYLTQLLDIKIKKFEITNSLAEAYVNELQTSENLGQWQKNLF